ncbi:MAG TPA: AAA family ATPase [Acidimicrobiales bacterium]|nr:AAA family ATPase [Acidimicrobiales bacterium]
MTENATHPRLVGRDQPLARLHQALDRSAAGARQVVVVTGESGIGKTSLVRAASEERDPVAWGTCIDDTGAPGYWPWSRVLDDLARSVGVDRARDLAGDDGPLLAIIAPLFGSARTSEASGRERLLLMDAVTRWVEQVAQIAPVVVVLDDLQWADDSSLALLDFVARAPRQVPLCVVGSYRDRELSPTARDRLADLVVRAEHIELRGLDRDAVEELVASVAGPVSPAVVERLHRRAGGHPVFTRELALLGADQPAQLAPSAVRDAIERRVRRLPESTQRALEVSALVGNEVYPDVVANVLDTSVASVQAACAVAVEHGVLTAASRGRARFAHDLYRETLAASVSADQRPHWHQAIGVALEARAGRGDDVEPADLAHHFAAAIAADGSERAGRWALAAAAREHQSLAFAEAAGHLRRWRSAVADAGVAVDDELLLDVLLAEAGALARAGDVLDARGLLRFAREVATRNGPGERVAAVALAVAELGAQFSARRDDVVRELEQALSSTALSPAIEARLTATLARELQHSVAADRPRAQPLSERALELGRAAADPATLVSCLLARHDVLWTPGQGAARVDIAREIVDVAERSGDDERRAEGFLLLANALLEEGSSAFRPALDEFLALTDSLGQPRHRYTAETRRAALALLVGDFDEAEARIEAAAAVGERIREPDTHNVRMSQRLELVRAQTVPEDLVRFADDAVAHWTGAPVHAHAVAAGFRARAGDVDGARRHVNMVMDLGTWRADRSYLWSVLVRELAMAAMALWGTDLCEELLADLAPLGASCGVNGAVVAFAGSHAHTTGMLMTALGRDGRAALDQAGATYERLGAPGWAAEIERLGAGPVRVGGAPEGRSMRRHGRIWHIVYDGQQATVPHSKGMADLAQLLGRPGEDIHVLDLYGSVVQSGGAGEMVDRQALASYRRRLSDLDEEATEAESHNDMERLARVEDERTALLDELRRVSRPGHAARSFATYPAERARKAVAGRLRDAIRKLGYEMPALATHLDATVLTGTFCRYRSTDTRPWVIGISGDHDQTG